MKLEAPSGVGDPCVAGVVILSKNGIYEVEPEIGALLIECFGFIEIAAMTEKPKPVSAMRRGKPAARKVSLKDQTHG